MAMRTRSASWSASKSLIGVGFRACMGFPPSTAQNIGFGLGEKVPALGSPGEADRRQELMTRLWLIAKQAKHAARDHRGLRLVDASAGHASVGTTKAMPCGCSSASKVLA